MARQRSDRDPVTVVVHVAQIVEPPDVDEQSRTGEPQAQERNQRVPARENPGVLVAAEELHGLFDRTGTGVLERCGDHVPALAAASTARTMLW